MITERAAATVSRNSDGDLCSDLVLVGSLRWMDGVNASIPSRI